MEIYNADIVSYQILANRVIKEQMLSQSANTQKYKEADLARLKIFLTAFKSDLDLAQGVGNEYDLPKTDPRAYVLEENVVVKLVRNDMVNHVINLLILVRDEMVASPSASDSSGMQDDDYKRGHENIKRIENYIKDKIEVHSPLPFLESAPKVGIQGPGSGHI